MLQNLGIAHEGAGHHERAVELLTESVEFARRAGDPAHISSALRTLGAAAAARRGGDPRPALVLLHEAMEISRDLVERPGLTESLETAAAVAARQGDPRTGALLVGAANALREAAGGMRQPDEDIWVQAVVAGLRDELGAEAYEAAAAEGGAARTRRRRRPRAGAQRTLMSARMPCSSWPMERAVERVGPRRELQHQRARVARREVDLAVLGAARAHGEVVVVLAEVGRAEHHPPGRQRAVGRADDPLAQVDAGARRVLDRVRRRGRRGRRGGRGARRRRGGRRRRVAAAAAPARRGRAEPAASSAARPRAA